MCTNNRVISETWKIFCTQCIDCDQLNWPKDITFLSLVRPTQWGLLVGLTEFKVYRTANMDFQNIFRYNTVDTQYPGAHPYSSISSTLIGGHSLYTQLWDWEQTSSSTINLTINCECSLSPPYLDHVELCNAVLLHCQWEGDAVLFNQHGCCRSSHAQDSHQTPFTVVLLAWGCRAGL